MTKLSKSLAVIKGSKIEVKVEVEEEEEEEEEEEVRNQGRRFSETGKRSRWE